MGSQKLSKEIYEKFTWKIENFSCLKNVDKIHSEPFVLGGHPWRIRLYPKGNNVATHLSIYLEAMQTANMSEGWSRHIKFKLFVFNQLNRRKTITIEYQHDFNAERSDWGHASFLKLTKLHGPKRGFIVNDTCIVGAEVFVCKSSGEKQVNQSVNVTTSLSFGGETGHVETSKELVCNESTATQADVELVYAALGRVIYFLKSRKAKDMMNEQACKELQVLWDELKTFKFDVTWLEPHVEYAFMMKSYVEKTMEAEKLKENMAVLQLEMERLKVKSVAAEVNLDIERNMLKAKGFKEMGIDSQLGCESWGT